MVSRIKFIKKVAYLNILANFRRYNADLDGFIADNKVLRKIKKADITKIICK